MSFRRALSLIIAAIALFISAGVGQSADARMGPLGSLAPNSSSKPIDPVGTAFLISNITNLAEANPAIAYDSAHAEYLAVWYNDRTSNDDISAQRFSKTGSLIGNPISVATGGATIDRRYPRVAYNVKGDQFLVVWEQNDSNNGGSIHGSRVSWDGVVLDKPNDIVIDTDGDSTFFPTRPVVAYAYTSDKYLVVWQEFWQPVPSYNNIYGRIVLSTGSLGSSVINIAQTDSAHTQANPDLAYDLATNEYLVVWQQLDPVATLTDVWGRRVSGEGVAQGTGPFVVASYTKSSTAPSVAALPTQPYWQYLVVWEQNYNPDDRDIMGRLVASDGTYDHNVDIPISVTNLVDELQPDVAASPARGVFLVTWKQVAFPFSSIYGRLVTPAGSTGSDSFNMGGIVAGTPRLAAGWNGDFGMVYGDVNFSLDWGIYGWLIGNRQYIPHVNK